MAKNVSFKNFFIVVIMLGGGDVGAGDWATQGRRVYAFDYQGVSLDSHLLAVDFYSSKQFLLRIPNDDLLKPFRESAGYEAPGVELGGWYNDTRYHGAHIFGQFISALARMYAATGDARCRQKLEHLVAEWGATIGEDGSFHIARSRGLEHYTYEKLIGGLLDAHEYADNAEALKYLDRITDWAMANLDRSRIYGHDRASTGGEWYTLSENLYRAHVITGERKYRDFAEVWEYTEYWERFAMDGGADIFAGLPPEEALPRYHYHAYSHVNTLNGLAAAHIVKGDSWYLETLIRSYDYLKAEQCWATGGFGPGEDLKRPDELLGSLLDDNSKHFETQCGSLAAFKMARYLITLTGDARYGDWIERLIYNATSASLAPAADGRVHYGSDYNILGGRKYLVPTRWSCCAGTQPILRADYHNLVYFKDSDTLYVNLYAPSTVRWDRAGDPLVAIQQRTRFPEENHSTFHISVDVPSRFRLAFRVPEWLRSDLIVRVNDDLETAAITENNWLIIERKWMDQDRVEVILPMQFELVSAPTVEAGAYPAALMYGPVVLAFRSDHGNPARHIDAEDLEKNFIPLEGERLAWRVRTVPSILVRPYYMFRENEPYFIYLDTDLPDGEYILTDRIRWRGNWRGASGRPRHARSAGATAAYTFEGTGVRWHAYKFPNAGKVEVSVTGHDPEVIDLYYPKRYEPLVWERRGLSHGEHTVKVRVLGEKNDASADAWVAMYAFSIPSDCIPPRRIFTVNGFEDLNLGTVTGQSTDGHTWLQFGPTSNNQHPDRAVIQGSVVKDGSQALALLDGDGERTLARVHLSIKDAVTYWQADYKTQFTNVFGAANITLRFAGEDVAPKTFMQNCGGGVLTWHDQALGWEAAQAEGKIAETVYGEWGRIGILIDLEEATYEFYRNGVFAFSGALAGTPTEIISWEVDITPNAAGRSPEHPDSLAFFVDNVEVITGRPQHARDLAVPVVGEIFIHE